MAGFRFVYLILVISGVLVVSAEEYNYDEKGEDWGDLCATGTKQSPINIDEESGSIQVASDDSSAFFEFDLVYNSISVEGTFNSHTYIADSGSYDYGTMSLNLDDDTEAVYLAQQFHFHAPSEHTFNGLHTDLELHIVHISTDGQIAVIALYFDVSSDDENEFLKSVIESELDATKFDLSDLLEHGILDDVYTYTGSLTTPPCTEGVRWIVTKEIASMSAAQLDFFENEWADNPDFANGNGNNRIIQNLNDRVVYEVNNESDDYGKLLMMAGGALLSLIL